MIYGHVRRSDIGLAWLARDFDQEFDAHFREDDGEGGKTATVSSETGSAP